MHLILMPHKAVKYLIKTGYDPEVHGRVSDYIANRTVDVDFFNRPYNIDPILAQALSEIHEELRSNGVEYDIENIIQSSGRYRGIGQEWRGENRSVKRMSSHALGVAVDFGPGTNCFRNRDLCSDSRIVTPVYAHKSYDVLDARYDATDEKLFLELFWNYGFNTPMEWAEFVSGYNSSDRTYSSASMRDKVYRRYRNKTFQELFDLLFHRRENPEFAENGALGDYENRSIRADWMHFELPIDREGNIIRRSLNSEGKALSYPDVRHNYNRVG